eukprot:TRINITY_DN1012_c0_g1_i2.p1 TRINITY_DN1012_c0_g1~~TRINITY_DN1012_c0_g1_i2.p1  ORF type:complete len:219 (-),score=8.48 TRINITY_DN1012_c0_g1_i2:91-747(-)
MSGAPPRGLRSSHSASAKVGRILAAVSRRHKFTKTHQRLYMDKALHSTQLPHKTAAQARRERAGNSPVSACECVAWARERQKKHKNTVLCHELHSIYCTDRRSPTGSFPKTTSFRQTPRTRNKNTIINKLINQSKTTTLCTVRRDGCRRRRRALSRCSLSSQRESKAPHSARRAARIVGADEKLIDCDALTRSGAHSPADSKANNTHNYFRRLWFVIL